MKRLNLFLLSLVLGTSTLFCQTTPRDSVEVLSDEEIEELFKKGEQPPKPVKPSEPVVEPEPEPEPKKEPVVEEDYVVEPDTFIQELDMVFDHDTVVEEAPFVEDIQFDAVIPYPYTVNEGDKQVFFSKGNLQYQGSTHSWRFARHQYDYIGGNGMGNVLLEDGTVCSNNDLSRTYRGWIDLFGFGTSGWNSGAKAYMPYNNEIPETSYRPGGSYTNDLLDDYEKADWGIFNVVDGYTPGTWYTLTADEWEFLIKKRPDADKLCGFGMVGNVRGFILLPDGWNLENPFVPGCNGLCRDNVFTVEQWDDTMESKGAVFLPAGGSRKGVGTAHVNVAGYYQSVSTAENIPANTYTLFFIGTMKTGMVDPKHSSTRSEGFNVRLVKDVK